MRKRSLKKKASNIISKLEPLLKDMASELDNVRGELDSLNSDFHELKEEHDILLRGLGVKK